MAAAPPANTWGGASRGNGLPSFVRIDLNALTVCYDTSGTANGLSKYRGGAFLYTSGGGVVDSSAVGPLIGESNFGDFYWAPSGKDSSENLIMSKMVVPGASDSTQIWFYAKFDKVFATGGDQMIGLNDGSNPFGGTVNGSPWEPGTWDGTMNDSHDGSLYFNLRGTTGTRAMTDTLFSCCLIANGGGAYVDTTFIPFEDPLPPRSTKYLTLAFHVFGTDSVQYYAGGTTGTMDLTTAWGSIGGERCAALMLANRSVMGATFDGGMTVDEVWIASAPR